MAVILFLHNLERILDQKGLSKTDLANLLGVHVGTIHNWSQRKSLPETKLFIKLIEVLEIDPQELFLPQNSIADITKGMSDFLSDVLHDAAKIKDKNDEILLSLMIEELVTNGKALKRYMLSNQGESSKLLIQSQKIRLLEMAQKISGMESVQTVHSPLEEKFNQLNETQRLMIESAIDGLLSAEAKKTSKKEVS